MLRERVAVLDDLGRELARGREHQGAGGAARLGEQTIQDRQQEGGGLAAAGHGAGEHVAALERRRNGARLDRRRLGEAELGHGAQQLRAQAESASKPCEPEGVGRGRGRTEAEVLVFKGSLLSCGAGRQGITLRPARFPRRSFDPADLGSETGDLAGRGRRSRERELASGQFVGRAFQSKREGGRCRLPERIVTHSPRFTKSPGRLGAAIDRDHQRDGAVGRELAHARHPHLAIRAARRSVCRYSST